MPLINRLSSGRIFVDEFEDRALNPIWQVSPSDPTRYDANFLRDGYLRVNHGDIPFYLLMDMPNRDFVFEIKNDYFPIIENDAAGIVIYQDNYTHIELLEYFDPELGSINYTHMRVSKKGDTYTGYGSHDDGATWQIIGSGLAEGMPKIGITLLHPEHPNSATLDVDYVKIFGDNKFVVSNLVPGMTMELLDELDNVIQTRTCAPGMDHVYIDVTNLPVPYSGKLRAYNAAGFEQETTPVTQIWGGDVFWYGITVEIYRDGILLPKHEETSLGYMIEGVIEESLTVKNPGSFPVSNVVVSKSSYFDYAGAEWVKISEDNGAGQPLSYQNSVPLGTLQPGETRRIWVRIQKEFSLTNPLLGDRKFFLEITH